MSTQRHDLIVSILFVVFGGPGIVLVYLPLWITHFRIPNGEPLWQMLIAAVLIFAGLAPALESVRRFIYVGRGTLIPVAPPEHLVVSGFYRYVRNPMYVGVMVALTGEAILFWNRGLVIEAILPSSASISSSACMRSLPSAAAILKSIPTTSAMCRAGYRASRPGTAARPEARNLSRFRSVKEERIRTANRGTAGV